MARMIMSALVGLVLGIGVTQLLQLKPQARIAERRPANQEVETPPQVDHPSVSQRVERAPPGGSDEGRTANDRREVATPQDEQLIGDALWDYARDGVRGGWSFVRADSIPDDSLAEGLHEFEETVLGLPEAIGRRLGERETAREAALEDARTGGAQALLERLLNENAGPVPELVSDAEAFGTLFPRNSAENPVNTDGRLSILGKEAEDGQTWQFPAGVFAIGNVLGDKDPFPRDVTLAGAGMESTLIVLTSDLGSYDDLRRFEIRDCTIFTDGNYLFDHRRDAATVVMNRVRTIGFDSGAGASCALSFRAGIALYVRNCRFEAGYGRAPQHGRLFRVQHPALVARFENSTISSIRLDARSWNPNATLVFANCALIDLLSDLEADAAGRRGISFPGTVIEQRDRTAEPPEPLDLNDLFPNWRERMVR